MSLLVNDVFEHNGQRYRLLAVSPLEECAFVIRLGDNRALPFRWRLAELNELAAKGKLSRLGSDAGPRPTGLADIAIRDLRWSRIKDLVTAPGICDRKTRGYLVRLHAQRIGVTKETLLANLRLWWLGGQVIDALLGNYYRCGRLDEFTEGAAVFVEKSESGVEVAVFAPATDRARGRRASDYVKFSISAALRKRIFDVAWKHLEQDDSKSVPGAVTAVLSKLFCELKGNGEPLLDENGSVVLRPVGKRPTKRQIGYLIAKVKPLSAAWKARNGAAQYANNHAPRTGTVMDDTLGPGDVYEVDATLVDLYVVARAHRAKVIGKATLYLVIDRSTRLIVGFHLSLENPAWAEAVHAILSIAGDWKALCKRLRIPYDARDWPAQGRMPNRFFADRADMITGASDALCDGVQTQLTNAVALMSADKAIVESGFKTVHQPLRQFGSGYEPPEKYKKRRAKHYYLDATLTLDELAAKLLRIVISHNRQYKRGYDASPEQILTQQSLAPRDLWVQSKAMRMGAGARMPVEVLRRKLLTRGKATVTSKGVLFGHCFYEATELKEWLVRASLRGQFEVEVSYTSSLVNTVIVHHPNDATKEYVAALTGKSRKWSGYNFAEVHAVMTVKEDSDRQGERHNEAHRVAAYHDIQGIASEARAATQRAIQAMPPGASRLNGAAEERRTEGMERREEVHDLSKLPEHFRREDSDVVTPAEGGMDARESLAESAAAADVGPEYALLPTSANERSDVAPSANAALMKAIREISSEEDDDEQGV